MVNDAMNIEVDSTTTASSTIIGASLTIVTRIQEIHRHQDLRTHLFLIVLSYQHRCCLHYHLQRLQFQRILHQH